MSTGAVSQDSMWCLKLARVRCAKTSDVSQDMQSVVQAPMIATYEISGCPPVLVHTEVLQRAETVRPCCKFWTVCVFGHGNDRSQQLHVVEQHAVYMAALPAHLVYIRKPSSG